MELFLIIITLALLAYLIIRLHDLQQSMKNDVHGSVQFSSEQLRNSNQLIANVTEKLVTIEQSQQQVLSFAGQLQRLEQVFQNPKRRGLIGEYMLAEQLREILPRHTYDLQYRLINGSIVDAVIHFRDLHIPIDAKFPLENFAKADRDKDFFRDVRLRIDETSLYISPSDTTTPFAFMYVPAEGVMEKLLEEDIIQYAFQKKVILVSPISFFAYLQTVIQGLNALTIELKTKEMLDQLASLRTQLGKWQEEVGKVGKYLDQAKVVFDQSNRRAVAIDARLQQIDDLDTPEELEAVIHKK